MRAAANRELAAKLSEVARAERAEMDGLAAAEVEAEAQVGAAEAERKR